MRYLEDRMEDNQERTVELLKSTDRPGIDGLINWMIGMEYFESPASTRLDYHGCHPGGLAEHSLNVYDLFADKVKRFHLAVDDEEVIIASLCHDLCKVGLYEPNVLKSGKLSETKPYVVKDNFPFGHGEKSVVLARQHIELTTDEMLMMRWHMGNFDSEWENYEAKVAEKCPAIYAFQFADHEASKYMDYRE